MLPSQRERDARRSRRNARVLSAAAVVALIVGTVAVGTQFFGDGTDQSPSTTAGGSAAEADQGRRSAPATLLTTSGATYSKDQLSTQVAGLVTTAEAQGAPLTTFDSPTDTPPATPSPSAKPVSYAAEDVVADPAPRLTCIAKLVEGAAELPIAMDAGAWRAASKDTASPTSGSTTPAVVVVLAGEDPQRVEVYVVSPSCADPADLDAHLLYFAFVPRP